MANRSVFLLTVGGPGAGKTYRRCAHYLVNEFLPNHDGDHWSNFPIGDVPEGHTLPPRYPGETFIERIALEAERRHKVPAAVSRERLKLIPREVIEAWRRRESGPWDFFADIPMDGVHLAIDEAHNFIAADHPKAWRQHWQEWLGEIRHEGATVEFITQHPMKVAKLIRDHATQRIDLVNVERERDPFFRIPFEDWFELRAGFTRKGYSAFFIETERRQGDDYRGKKTDRRVIPVDPSYFLLYDSYSASHKTGKKGTAPKRQYQRRSKAGLVLWFAARNGWNLLSRAAVLVLIWWITLGGGVGYLVGRAALLAGGLGGASRAAETPAGPAVELASLPAVPAEAPPAPPAVPDGLVRLAAVTGGRAVIEPGGTVRLGGVVSFGPLAGQRLEDVDAISRTARFGRHRLRVGELYGVSIGSSVGRPGVPDGGDGRRSLPAAFGSAAGRLLDGAR